ncbi:MAG: hypothetical protein GC162_15885 [Planctomycetes bacterium]|nr:hypothetical protein [Planctomycetota bacterium]
MKKTIYIAVCVLLAAGIATGVPLWDDFLPGNSVRPPRTETDPSLAQVDVRAIRDLVPHDESEYIESITTSADGSVNVWTSTGGGAGHWYVLRKTHGRWECERVMQYVQ